MTGWASMAWTNVPPTRNAVNAATAYTPMRRYFSAGWRHLPQQIREERHNLNGVDGDKVRDAQIARDGAPVQEGKSGAAIRCANFVRSTSQHVTANGVAGQENHDAQPDGHHHGAISNPDPVAFSAKYCEQTDENRRVDGYHGCSHLLNEPVCQARACREIGGARCLNGQAQHLDHNAG